MKNLHTTPLQHIRTMLQYLAHSIRKGCTKHNSPRRKKAEEKCLYHSEERHGVVPLLPIQPPPKNTAPV